MKHINTVRLITTYDAGQYPEVARLNAGSMLAAAEAALEVGLSHHNIKPADAMRIVRRVMKGVGQPDEVSTLRCVDLADACRMALVDFRAASSGVYRIEVQFACSPFILRISRARLY